jgi:alpha-L-fucosidase
MGASFTWFQVSRGSDKTGPYAGVPYDGNDPAYADLYHAKTLPGDTGWYTNNPVFQHEWAQRITDLIDNYHPDLLYSDGPFPFGEIGEGVIAHYYNQSRNAHGGQQEVVYTCKQPSQGRWTQDLERGVQGKIQPYPWQTDTSIGDWFYNKHWKYRGADWVLHTLIDVVSKNGNLLINVVQRPDGSLDSEAEQVLVDMANWMKVNSESIYNTTPWIAFGEGPVRAKGGSFSEDFAFTEQDYRYAAKGESTLYATSMGSLTPGEHVLKLLASGLTTSANVTGVKLLGGKPVMWSWKADGLHVTVPEGSYSSIANVFKISGIQLRDFKLAEPEVSQVRPDAAGNFVLKAGLAELNGSGVNTETRDGQENLGFWDDPKDSVSWLIEVPASGDYLVTADAATPSTDSKLNVNIGAATTTLDIHSTGDWAKFSRFRGGVIHLSKGSKIKVTASPASPDSWHPINLRAITLLPRLAQ